MTTIAHEWVDDQSAFERILTEVSGVDRYAIDTEFHRERTYYPKLALVQICLLYTSPSPRDKRQSRMPSSA